MALTLPVILLIAQAAVQPAVPAPPRDTAAKKGTATIQGKVTAADSGRPLRRVQVSLSSPDLEAAKSISTTAAGLFEFRELPAGRYTLSFSRPGYLRVQYGQKRPGESGRPVRISDGQQLADVDVALTRTSSITGRVTDELGDPLPEVYMFPMQRRYFRGKRQLVRASGGGSFNQTDETGQFRITGLEPGEYFVMAHTRGMWNVDGKPDEKIGFLPTYAPGTASPTEALRVSFVIPVRRLA